MGLVQNVRILVYHDYSKSSHGFDILSNYQKKWVWTNKKGVSSVNIWRFERGSRFMSILDGWG